MFSPKEIALLYGIAIKDEVISNKNYNRGDKEGLSTKLALWYSLDDSIYSLVARLERIVSGVELLLEGEPAHFHSKLIQKEPKVGGAWGLYIPRYIRTNFRDSVPFLTKRKALVP